MQRRTFLKAAAIGGGVALGFDLKEARAEMRQLKISRTTETRSTCPYCAVSCGVIIPTLKDDITHKNRILTPKVRRPGSDRWEDVSWEETISKIARHVKDTRDRCFVAKNAAGQVVNRNPGLAMIGGCTDTNEFNFLQWKVVTALGVPYRDTQARV